MRGIRGAFWTGIVAIVLFTPAVPFSFVAGRAYLKSKKGDTRHLGDQENGCCACPGGMAISAWVVYGVAVLNNCISYYVVFEIMHGTGPLMRKLVFLWVVSS